MAMNSVGDINVRLIESRDFDSVINILERDYILNEPITRSFILNKGGSATKDEIKAMMKSMNEIVHSYPALVLAHKDRVIGYVAMIEIDLKNPNESKDMDPNTPLYELNNGMGTIVKNLGLFENFPTVKRVVKLRAMVIDREYQGRGLSTLLLKESLIWAKDQEIELVYSFFNSPASKKAAQKLGFKVISEYDLLDYRNPEGRTLFASIPEHITYLLAYKF